MMSGETGYEVLEKIGHGSFGVIRKVRRKTDGMVLCRKEISYLKMSQKEREQLHAEFQILSTLRHPNIVGYYHREHLKQSQDLHLYMEYCGNGDLGRVIRELQAGNRLADESFVWSIFAQLVTALYRCHYGVDPPEVGKAAAYGLGAPAKPKTPAGGMTILHRDLKPENVFLGEDNSVKLGDFGLSKMIQSHDFASTYVGTPFYMSPEICAAEKYTLKSDIWSLGCIIYELCAREPPFNAKSHFQLVQKIKDGRFARIPALYSAELTDVIASCLRVNPDRRPDTAELLNLPVVRLMRKEREVVDLGRLLRQKEETVGKRLRELDQRLAGAEADRAALRAELDASLRREWEVKARLEIDRLVGLEMEQLQRKFEEEVQARVAAEVAVLTAQQSQQNQPQSLRKTVTFRDRDGGEPGQDLSSSASKSDYPHSSVGTASFSAGDMTDLTELSLEDSGLEEPVSGGTASSGASSVLKKGARTPFGRAQTMFAGQHGTHGTPMDVEMASPSPAVITSLSLSPRHTAGARQPAFNPTSNIFARNNNNTAGGDDLKWDAVESDSDDDELPLPSPTRNVAKALAAGSKNPFTSRQRPQLLAQKTAPTVHQLRSKVGMLNGNNNNNNNNNGRVANMGGVGGANPTITAVASAPDLQHQTRGRSPNRRLSKIPSAANLFGTTATTTTTTNTTTTNTTTTTTTAPGSSSSSSSSNNNSSNSSNSNNSNGSGTSEDNGGAPTSATGNAGGEQPVQPPKLTRNGGGGNNIKGRTLVELQQARAGGRPLSGMLAETANVSPKRAFREQHAGTLTRGGAMLEPPAVWDPERDEMPSPFLVRRKPIARV